MRIEVTLDRIGRVLEGIEVSDNACILLADAAGQTIYRHGTNNLDVQELDEGGFYKRYLVTKADLPGTGWSLYYLADKSELRVSQGFTFLAAFLLCLAILLAAWLIYQRRSKETLHSVDDILHTLTLIQNGDFDVRSQVESGNELAAISNGVNQMAEKIKEHINREYKAVIEQQNAEYRALQAQINPHFLYNILNDFIALNRMGETQMLEQSILQLTQIFRYTCSGGDKAALREELDFCRDYLELRRLQLDDRLSFTIDADAECENEWLPKLVLQPLVENSLLHGLGAAEEKIHIEITARYTGSGEERALQITVRDNGQGFDLSAAGGGRVGLQNVQKRVNMFYPGGEIEIQSAPGRGTLCTILIPRVVD